MQTGALTSYIDVAQLTLYAFWLFFAGLVYYLLRENKREGYPMIGDRPGTHPEGWPGVPPPKTFLLADGAGATHEKLWVEPDRLLLTSKQSSTLRTYAFSQPR